MGNVIFGGFALDLGEGDGPFFTPIGAEADAEGNVYVADADNHRIHKFLDEAAISSEYC